MASVTFSGAAERARQALAKSTIHVLRKIEVECETDAIVLRGCVDSFYHKQLAQELVRAAAEGVEVVNELEVDYRRGLTDSHCDW
jgi:osmotically-inducible protein OsmY